MFTLHNGDCLQVMPSIPSGSIDAIITDLPYGTTACKWDTIIPFEPMWKEVKRVLKPNGAFITTASQPFTSTLIMSNPSAFNCEWIWNKSKAANFPQVKHKPLKIHENIIVFYGSNYNPQKEIRGKVRKKGGYFVSGDVAVSSGTPEKYNNEYYPKSILDYSIADNKGAGKHPTQKPVALYEYLIRTYTNEGETVLDIAMGSGTTIEAAERTGRNSIGIEKDKGIFETAVLRLKPFTPSNNRLHMDAGDSPRQPSQSTLEGFTPAEQGTTPAPRQ